MYRDSDYTYDNSYSEAGNMFVTKVFGWMSLALTITAVVAMLVATTPDLVKMIVQNQIVFLGLILAEFGVVIWLSGWIDKMSAATATAAFVGYSLLSGLTFSVIFLAYTMASITSTFFITAGTFGTMCIYGYITKRDLTHIGNLCFMCLIGLIIASLVNFFMQSSALYWVITFGGVIIFVGLTAYDTQKIKKLGMNDFDYETGRKAAVMGALALYLDFVNLFLLLLRLFGRRR